MGEGREEALADGAARGRSVREMSRRASGEKGMRAPKVAWVDVTSGASGEGVGSGRRIVSGPGQKAVIRGW